MKFFQIKILLMKTVFFCQIEKVNLISYNLKFHFIYNLFSYLFSIISEYNIFLILFNIILFDTKKKKSFLKK